MEVQKTKAARGSLNQNVLLGGENSSNDNIALSLDEGLVNQILETPSLTANQQRRFIETLARHPNITTKRACRTIGCVNLSHLRRKTKKVLHKFNLEARCTHPNEPIKNGFGEVSGQKLWGLYRLEVADDSVLL